MKTKKLSNQSIEQLKKKKKNIRNIVLAIGLLMIITFSTLLYFSFITKSTALIAIVFGSLFSLLPAFTMINHINTEIKSRKSQYL